MNAAVPILFDAAPGRVRRLALIVGAVGLALCVLGLLVDPRQAWFSYLTAFVFWGGLALGSLALLMTHHLTGGTWGFLLRRPLEAMVGTMPLVAILFVPLFFGQGQLYPWAMPGSPPAAVAEGTLRAKSLYLNYPALTVRSVILFGCWLTLATLLIRWSREQDDTTDLAPTRRMRKLSGPGVVLFAFTATLGYVDWAMVLENDWYSSVFPALAIIGHMLSALAGAVALLVWLGHSPPMRGRVRPEDYRAFGNLLLAFVMLWAYLAVSQLIIIWSGNLPREISWYLHRSAGGWRWVAVFLTVCGFVIPFCLLLSRAFKARPGLLAGLALAIMGVHAVEVLWLVAPTLHPAGFAVSWLDFAAFIGVGGVWLATFLAALNRAPLLPSHDPRITSPELLHAH